MGRTDWNQFATPSMLISLTPLMVDLYRCEELARILNECKQQLHKMEIAMEAFRDQGDCGTIKALSENVSRQLHYVLHK